MANHSAHGYILFGQHSVILIEFECFKWDTRSSFLQPHTPSPRSVQQPFYTLISITCLLPADY